MQYNDTQYNNGSYNFTQFALGCLETVTITDDLAKMPSITRVDSQATVDALSDGVSMAALLDSVQFQHRARYANPYGAFGYNEAMYNLIEDDDEVLLQAMKVVTDNVSSSDSVATIWTAYKDLVDSIGSSDFIAPFTVSKVCLEFMFLSELFRIEVTNKALNEIIRVGDWVQVERLGNENNGWYD